MTPQEVEDRLNTDLFFFAEEAPIVVKDKQGMVVRWVPNRAQRYMQFRAEDQKKRKGYVRILLLKGRQQGGSTWVEMRDYHILRSNAGISVLVLSHDAKATRRLYAMVELAHENVDPALRPATGKANVNQLTFPGLGSDYSFETAGSPNAGRGGTAQLLHWSEVAYTEHDFEIQDGALESLALLPGTEAVLESTANGPRGLFYIKVQMAVHKIGDYEVVFVPWFWQEEYLGDGSIFEDTPMTEEERHYVDAYLRVPFFGETAPPSDALVRNLMAWRRSKTVEFAMSASGFNMDAGRAKFKAIYPSNPVEAFLYTGIGLIQAEAIELARKSTIVDAEAPLIAGVDPAGDSANSDRTVIAIRRGRVLEDVIVFPKMRPMKLAAICANLIDNRSIDKMFVDRGYGEGTIDALRELGYGDVVTGVAFNEGSLQPDVYLNKRSEIMMEFAKWVNGRDVRIPDRDDVHADIAAIPLDETTANGLKFIKSTREIKKLLNRSPDIYMACSLTMAYPVRRRDAGPGGSRVRIADSSKSELSSMSRMNRKRAA